MTMNHLVIMLAVLGCIAGCCSTPTAEKHVGESDAKIEQLEKRVDQLEKRLLELDSIKVLPVK